MSERELGREGVDLDLAQNALDAIKDGLKLPGRFPFTCRKVCPNPFVRQLSIPFWSYRLRRLVRDRRPNDGVKRVAGMRELAGQFFKAGGAIASRLILAFCAFWSPQASLAASLFERFEYEVGYFTKVEDRWIEQRYNETARYATYIEEKRDGAFIYLVDPDRVHEGKRRKLYVRIPVSGGMSEFAWDSPTTWRNLIYLRSGQ